MKKLHFSLFFILIIIGSINSCFSQQIQGASKYWPTITQESKPWTRWWWLGSAVDEQNIKHLIKEYSAKDIGGVEITPIYGVIGEEKNYIDFLSPEWIQMLSLTIKAAHENKMGVDMNTGTGWPFGGPYVSNKFAAKKLQFHNLGNLSQKKVKKFIDDINLSDSEYLLGISSINGINGRLNLLNKNIDINDVGHDFREVFAVTEINTGQKVKRAAPGGEGLVFNHFSKDATVYYLKKFNDAFAGKIPGIRSFFNDSYELSEASSSTKLFEVFRQLKEYDLSLYTKELMGKGDTETIARIKSDYREVLGEMLLSNFTNTWTNWAHKNGSKTKNQAHGSPANLIDLYSAVDIPEVETFHATNFPFLQEYINRSDALQTESKPLFKKFASSAAHINGNNLVSCETFTWLNEHFKTPLYQCKPELDDLFTKGVNHVFFHGTSYSPKQADWPGWLFYASTHMQPNNPQWEHIDAMNLYISRCQSVLQSGNHTNDFLVYWPIWDYWHKPNDLEKKLTLHNSTDWINMPEIDSLNNKGYDFDFITDKIINNCEIINNQIYSIGKVPYNTILIPKCERMPLATFKKILNFAHNGLKVVFSELPKKTTGFSNWKENEITRSTLINNLHFTNVDDVKISHWGKGEIWLGNPEQCLKNIGVTRERLPDYNIKYISRKKGNNTYYFIANHEVNSIDAWLPFKHGSQNALILNPLNGSINTTDCKQKNDFYNVRVKLSPGCSTIILFTDDTISTLPKNHYFKENTLKKINGPWTLNFINGGPELPSSKKLTSLCFWTDLDGLECKSFSGLASYSTTFNFNKKASTDYLLRIEEVQASVKVYINEQTVATLWSFPFEVSIGPFLKKGKNSIRLEVANLGANRIRHLEKQNTNWKKFHDINFVNINYKSFDASNWNILSSGLSGKIEIIELTEETKNYKN